MKKKAIIGVLVALMLSLMIPQALATDANGTHATVNYCNDGEGSRVMDHVGFRTAWIENIMSQYDHLTRDPRYITVYRAARGVKDMQNSVNWQACISAE